jgi:hypothetical protein
MASKTLAMMRFIPDTPVMVDLQETLISVLLRHVSRTTDWRSNPTIVPGSDGSSLASNYCKGNATACLRALQNLYQYVVGESQTGWWPRKVAQESGQCRANTALEPTQRHITRAD